ncbi:MAG: hypothetical protein IJM99_08955 [Firmicutes bacterium]|nr:hypothetical protein [Bacillota bacterium]MBQ6686222.1 hypothetical protein [Bacillota bacterium]
MVRIVRDGTFGYTSVFNDVTGEYLRGTNCEEDPFMAEFPHLIDVGWWDLKTYQEYLD